MASYGSDYHDVEQHGGRSRRAPIAFNPTPSTSSPSRARRAHPGGTITRIYPPNFDPNDRTHRFHRQRSASSTPRPEDTVPAAQRQPTSYPRHDHRRHRHADDARNFAARSEHPFPDGLPPHLIDEDDSAHPAADSLDGPWPAYEATGDADAADDSDGWEDGRAHSVQQDSRAAVAQRAAAGDLAAVSPGAALDLGMEAPGTERNGGRPAHGSMAADFMAGAPVVYVNDSALMGWDAVQMQRRMEEEQQPVEQALLVERLAVEQAEEQAWAAEALAVRSAEALRRKAEAEERIREMQAQRRPAQPLRRDAAMLAGEDMTAYPPAGYSNGASGPHPQETFAVAGRAQRLVRALDAGREPVKQHRVGASARLVIPEGWDDDEPMDIGHEGPGINMTRRVQIRAGWGEEQHNARGQHGARRGHRLLGNSSGGRGRGIHAPKHLEPSSPHTATAVQTFRRPRNGPAAQLTGNISQQGPAPAPQPQLSVEDRLGMSLDSIASCERVSTPGGAAGPGRGAGACGAGQPSARGRGNAGRGNGGGAGRGRGRTQQGSRPQQTIAAKQSHDGFVSVTGGNKRTAQPTLAPADKLSMSLDQIQKRRRV